MKEAKERGHVPVLEKEMLSFFSDMKIGVFFEGTVGAGGHAHAILDAHPEIVKYIGCDVDPEALAIAGEYLKPWEKKIEFIHGNFSNLDQYLKERKIKKVNGFFLTSECHRCN